MIKENKNQKVLKQTTTPTHTTKQNATPAKQTKNTNDCNKLTKNHIILIFFKT